MTRQRRPWWTYAIAMVVIAYLLSALVGGTVDAAATRGWAAGALNAVLYVAAAACCAATLKWERAGGRAVLLTAAVAVALWTEAMTAYAGTAILFFVVWLAPFRIRLWQAVALSAVASGAFVLMSWAASRPSDATFGIAAGLGWAMFFAAVVNQLAVTRRQAAVVAAARAREAVMGERERLAREIHDILAHSLSAQIVHLEGARLLLERGDHGPALERVARAGDMARAGLEESRRAVAALRGDEIRLTDQLERLAGEFRAASGAPCTVTVSGDPGRLPPEARLAVVRTAQEALTNVHKHASYAEVVMELRCGERWCELEVRDMGGTRGQLAASGNGYGLTGMRERAELLGGSLSAGPDGEGFAVRLRVPA
ncbi:sensor histidine kinase [Microbispora sp. NPDC049125]|uniref:sensor histidine kinase n=1 Tax=Microbispora sp. NPDC049125 TaxID=3154929 RepID=UPI003466CF35